MKHKSSQSFFSQSYEEVHLPKQLFKVCIIFGGVPPTIRRKY